MHAAVAQAGREVPPEASLVQTLLDDVREQYKILTDGISHSSDPQFAKFLLGVSAVLTVAVLVATCISICPSKPRAEAQGKKRETKKSS